MMKSSNLLLTVLVIASLLILQSGSYVSTQNVCTSSPGDTLESLVNNGCSHIILASNIALNSNLSVQGDLVVERDSSLSSPPTLTIRGWLSVSGANQVILKGINIVIDVQGTDIFTVNASGAFVIRDVMLNRSFQLFDDVVEVFMVVNTNVSVIDSSLGKEPEYLRLFKIVYSDSSPHSVSILGSNLTAGREALDISHSGSAPLEVLINNSRFGFTDFYQAFELARDSVKIVVDGGSQGNIIHIANTVFEQRGESGLQNATVVIVTSGEATLILGEGVEAPIFEAGQPPRQNANPIKLIGLGSGRVGLEIRGVNYSASKAAAVSLETYGDSSGYLDVSDVEMWFYSILLNVSSYENSMVNVSVSNSLFRDTYTFYFRPRDASVMNIWFTDIQVDVASSIAALSSVGSPIINVQMNNVSRTGVGNDPLLFMDLGGSPPGHQAMVDITNVRDNGGRLFQLLQFIDGYVEISVKDSVFKRFSVSGSGGTFFNISIVDSVFEEAERLGSSVNPLNIRGDGIVTVRWSVSIELYRDVLDPASNTDVALMFMGRVLASGTTDSNGVFTAVLEYPIYDSSRGIHVFVARYLSVVAWVDDMLVNVVLGLEENWLGPVSGGPFEVYADSLSIQGFGSGFGEAYSLEIDGRVGVFNIVSSDSVEVYSLVIEEVANYVGYTVYSGTAYVNGEALGFEVVVDGEGWILLSIGGETYVLRVGGG